jgi:hypothetical protein
MERLHTGWKEKEYPPFLAQYAKGSHDLLRERGWFRTLRRGSANMLLGKLQNALAGRTQWGIDRATCSVRKQSMRTESVCPE